MREECHCLDNISSYFIVAIPKEIILSHIADKYFVDYTALYAKIFPIDRHEFHFNFDERYNKHSVAESIYRDMNKQKAQQISKMTEQFRNKIFAILTKGPIYKHEQEDKQQYYNTWINKCNPDDFIYIFRYRNNRTPHEAMLEQSNIFRRLKQIRVLCYEN